MNKAIKSPPAGLQFFKLPFEKGTLRLTRLTLDKHSDFRRTERPYQSIDVRKISYHNEILIIGIELENENEERVYLQATTTELLVSCSVDTHEAYLSRHAYLALNRLIHFDDHYDFDKYYWPGFFDTKTGKSKYLTVINDRQGLDVFLKPKYSSFYKPEQKLIYPLNDKRDKVRVNLKQAKESIAGENGETIGYCLADTLLRSWHSNHLPFLIPYSGLLTNKKEAVKTYLNFIRDQDNLPILDYTPVQQKLNQLCFKMMELALIKSPEYQSTEKEREDIKRDNIRRRDKVFLLWQQAIPLLECQLFANHYHTLGMKNVIGKPRKKDMPVCSFSMEVPTICFLWLDQGDYYELRLRFKVGKKVFIPERRNVTFFISAKNDPKMFYLLETLTDYTVLTYFEERKLNISVLKSHYQQYFKGFKEQLAKVYEFIERPKSSVEIN
jgi:hypothetical protein